MSTSARREHVWAHAHLTPSGITLKNGVIGHVRYVHDMLCASILGTAACESTAKFQNSNRPILHGKGRVTLEAQSQHFRHADTNLANPRTSAWFMKSLRRDALLWGAELILHGIKDRKPHCWADRPSAGTFQHTKAKTVRKLCTTSLEHSANGCLETPDTLLETVRPQMYAPAKGRGYIAVPAYMGSLVESQKVLAIKPTQAGEQI
eukprot:1147717-Pelagomonas_calceolata.AAC.3